MSENTKTSWKGPPSSSVAPSLNFMFVPSSRNKHAVAKCCAQLGRVVERLGSGKGGLPACRRLLFPLLHAEKGRLRNAVAKRDVCATPSLIVFQHPAGFPRSWELAQIGGHTVRIV